jgi:hypothetical protein
MLTKYVIDITVSELQVTTMAATFSSTLALRADPDDRAEARRRAEEEFRAMSDAMVKEKGLLNHAQAALLLDVSTKRVGELVKLGKLRDFTFLGRKYVSMREVRERNEQELKAGRPRMPAGKRIKASLKAALAHDSLQVRQGGFQGPYQRKLREDQKRASKGKYRRKWQEIGEARKK